RDATSSGVFSAVMTSDTVQPAHVSASITTNGAFMAVARPLLAVVALPGRGRRPAGRSRPGAGRALHDLQVVVLAVFLPQALTQHRVFLGERRLAQLLRDDVLADAGRDAARRAPLDRLFRQARDRRAAARALVALRARNLPGALDLALLAEADATAAAAPTAEAFRIAADRRDLLLLARQNAVEIAYGLVELLFQPRLALGRGLARVLADAARAIAGIFHAADAARQVLAAAVLRAAAGRADAARHLAAEPAHAAAGHAAASAAAAGSGHVPAGAARHTAAGSTARHAAGSSTGHAAAGGTSGHAAAGSAAGHAAAGSTAGHAAAGSTAGHATAGSTAGHATAGSAAGHATAGSTAGHAAAGTATRHAAAGTATRHAAAGTAAGHTPTARHAAAGHAHTSAAAHAAARHTDRAAPDEERRGDSEHQRLQPPNHFRCRVECIHGLSSQGNFERRRREPTLTRRKRRDPIDLVL